MGLLKRKDLRHRLLGIGLTGRQADEALDAFFGSIVGALRQGGKVSIVGLGTWEWRVRPSRMARNPRTGQRVPLAARKTLLFRPSPGFKQNLRSKGRTLDS